MLAHKSYIALSELEKIYIQKSKNTFLNISMIKMI